tara:strand:+ start:3685 stop:3921 length:237 start_codon:yes stop_codon:yes gene_type:complete
VINKIEVGDLVKALPCDPGPLRPLLPLPDGGNGVVIEIKTTNVYPSKKTGLIYKILSEGNVYHFWGDSLERLTKLKKS